MNEEGKSTEGAFYLWGLDEIQRILVRTDRTPLVSPSLSCLYALRGVPTQ